MFKILLIILVIGAGVFYFKFSKTENKNTFPQFPQSLSDVSLSSVKDWISVASTQSAVLGDMAKAEGINYILDQAQKLNPEEYKTLQSFICAPTPKE